MPRDVPDDADEPPAEVQGEDWLLPSTLPVTVAPRQASSLVLVGYDGARTESIVRMTSDATLIGPVALRLGAHSAGGELAPTIGLRGQILSQSDHGLDAGLAAMYEALGYEGEPEVKAVVSVGRRIGPMSLVANAAYGQEIDENQRSGELHASALAGVAPGLRAGFEGRARMDLDAGRTTEGVQDVDFDFMAAVTATATSGRFAIVGQVGMSGFRFKGSHFQQGVMVLVGVGTRL